MSKNYDDIKAAVSALEYDYGQLNEKAFGKPATNARGKLKDIRKLAGEEMKRIAEEAKKAKAKAKA